MKPSLNEIDVVVRKAAVGVGWSYGVGEDVGRAAAWLVAQGHDGVGTAIAAIQPGASVARCEPTADGWAFPQARVAAVGLSAFELLAIDPSRRVILRNVDHPLLLIGLAGVAAVDNGGAYMLTGCTTERIAERINVSANHATFAGAKLTGETVSVERSTPSNHAPLETQAVAVIDDTVWRQALALAARTYVPASETSRAHGAGAGLTDND
ncbi:MAG: DUF3726 domain-containing protein [Pseudomonadota bacterium]